MMSLSWACLGWEGPRYSSFHHCVFHIGIRGAQGLWLNSHLSHACPPSLPLLPLRSPLPLRLSVTLSLQHSLRLTSLPFPSPACCHVLVRLRSLPMSLSRLLCLSLCLLCSSPCLTLFVSSLDVRTPRSLIGAREGGSGKKTISMWIFLYGKIRTVNWGRQQQPVKNQYPYGLKWLWLMTWHKNSCLNIYQDWFIICVPRALLRLQSDSSGDGVRFQPYATD